MTFFDGSGFDGSGFDGFGRPETDIMTSSFDPLLVIASYLIATSAAYVALTGRVRGPRAGGRPVYFNAKARAAE